MRRLIAAQRTITAAEEIQAGHDIRALTEQAGWPVLLSALDARADDAITSITNPTEDASKYADAIGRAKGLREIEDVAKSVLRRAEKVQSEVHVIEGKA